MTEPEIQRPARSPTEGRALLSAIDALAPAAPTACADWTVHEIVAHLAAGAKEVADLIEESLDGRPERPTRGFEERELPFRALSHDELRNRLVVENKRKLIAYDALRERSSNPTISFTGTRVTVEEMETHSRSEAAIHRWDLVGDDDASDELLAQPELTAHAVKVLDRMAILNESARAVGVRARKAAGRPIRIVFRTPDQPDVVFLPSPGGGRFEIADRTIDADVILSTDAASRLLT